MEGTRGVEELLAAGLPVLGAVLGPGFGAAPRERALRDRLEAGGHSLVEVDDRALQSAAATDQPQGIVAVAELPRWRIADLPTGVGARWLVVDAVQDPGNLGTVLRAALAFGVGGVLLLPGTVDPWNGKVVRSAMGASFRLPMVPVDAAALRGALADAAMPLWAADLDGEAPERLPRPECLALAVGNEGAGIGAEVRALAERVVTLPIAPGVESLNVAVATGILLYVLRP